MQAAAQSTGTVRSPEGDLGLHNRPHGAAHDAGVEERSRSMETAKSMDLEAITTCGEAFVPSESCRYSTWMPRGDPCLESWLRHFEAKGIACGVFQRANGMRAVFRDPEGMREPPPLSATKAKSTR